MKMIVACLVVVGLFSCRVRSGDTQAEVESADVQKSPKQTVTVNGAPAKSLAVELEAWFRFQKINRDTQDSIEIDMISCEKRDRIYCDIRYQRRTVNYPDQNGVNNLYKALEVATRNTDLAAKRDHTGVLNFKVAASCTPSEAHANSCSLTGL